MNFPKTTASVETIGSSLDAILDPSSDSPVISAQIWVATGSVHESALAGAGVSHLLEHMVFKGTDRFSGEALSQEVQAAGGQWNAYTTFDRTVYYIDGPAESLDLFLSALMEMVFRPAFPEEEFEKEKDVIRREIAMGLDDPDSVAHQLLFRTIYRKDHRRQPIIGHLDLFDSITHQQMVTYHHARYRPDNTFIVLSGGFNPRNAKEIIARELTKGLRPFAQFPVSVPIESTQIGTRRASESFTVPSTRFSMSWQVGDLAHPDTPALELLGTVLGGGRSSPLYRVIREEKDLAHSIGSYAWISPEGPGLFSVYAEADPEKIPQLEKEIITQITLLSSRDLSVEIKRARRQIASQQFKILASASGRASDLASNWHQTRNLDYTRDFLADLESITTEDLHRVIQSWLTPKLLSVTALTPKSQENEASKDKAIAPPEALVEKTLSNGVRVILQRAPRVPVVYGNVAMLAGCLSESQETAGLNALLSSLLLKGTTSRSAVEIAEFMEDMGASVRPGAGNNTLMVSTYCLRDDFTPVLELLEDLLIHPVFPADALERERASLLNQVKESLEDPASRAFRELRKLLWDGQGYGSPSSGSLESLPSLTRELLVTHHKEAFCAENMVCAFFGDLDVDETLAILEKTLGNIPSGNPLEMAQPVPAFAGEHSLKLDKEQAVLAIGYPGLSAADPERFALELIHSYCSDMAGPLFTRIREELGLAYFVSSTMFLGLNDGLMAFYLGTSTEQMELAREELMGQIERLANEGIDPNTLVNVKANARAAQALQNQSPKNRASMAALDVLLGHSADHHLQQDALMDAVTPEAIKSLAARLFADGKATIVTVSP